MKKMRDERLIFENLKHIRIAFMIQTLGILAILVVDGIQNGYSYEETILYGCFYYARLLY